MIEKNMVMMMFRYGAGWPVLFFFLMLVPLTAKGQVGEDSLNMMLYDHLQPIDSAGLHAAIWGYTAPDGREYALFGSQVGTHIIDVTERPIKEVAYIWGPWNPWREMKTYGTYAYIVSESRDSGAGLQIVDLSNLPESAELVRTDSSAFISAHTIYIRDHYLYAMGTAADAEANRAALILDLEPDPLHPRRVGSAGEYYYHDAFVRGDTLLGAAIYGEGLDIYNIGNPDEPELLTTIKYPHSGTHNAELTSDGGFVLTTDEVGFTPKTLKVWDIRDMESVTKVAEFTPNLKETVHNVHVKGRYAFVSWYTAGVRVVDMIDPFHPREVGFYDTYSGEDGGFSGVWEVYPFLPSGKILAGDRNTGLYVLEFNDAVAGSVSGTVRDAVTGDPLPGVDIYVPEYERTVTSDIVGRYYVGGVRGDEITLKAGLFGYGGISESVEMMGDVERDLLLDPLEKVLVTIEAVDEAGRPIEGFSYAIEPYIPSTRVDGTSGVVSLVRDSSYSVIVGKWGYALAGRSFTVTGQEDKVTAHLERHYQDDATLDLGWSYEDEGDMAVTGRWVRMIPYLGYPNSGWIHPATEPRGTRGYIFMTGAPPPFAPPGDGDVNGGYTTLTSPPMDLSDHVDPAIFFDRWFVHYKRDAVRDTFAVELSSDDGATWVRAYNETLGEAGWLHRAIFPTDFIPLTDRVRIRFRVSDTLGNTLVMAGIDNFDVYGRLASSVPGEPSVAEGKALVSVQPNPASSGASVMLRGFGAGSRVRLELFDARGASIGTIFEGELPAGEKTIALDKQLPAGLYLLRAVASDGTRSGVTLRVVR